MQLKKNKQTNKMDKSRKRVEQDYARNAIADGNTKAGKYEAKMAVKEAAGESPARMYGKKKGSPAHNQNKGYESAGQERKNLMTYNPIDSRASGGSWMSKHTSSRMGSPMRMDYGSPMEKELVGKQGNLPEALKSKIEAAPESPMKMADNRTDRKIRKYNKTVGQISEMQNKRSSIKDVYLGDPDDKTTDKIRTADKPASKREGRKIKKAKKTEKQIASPLNIQTDPRRLNKKGQSQKEVMDLRNAKSTSAQKGYTDFNNKIKNLAKGQTFSKDQVSKIKSRLDSLDSASTKAHKAGQFSFDSISKVNKKFNAIDKKKQDDAFNSLMGGK